MSTLTAKHRATRREISTDLMLSATRLACALSRTALGSRRLLNELAADACELTRLADRLARGAITPRRAQSVADETLSHYSCVARTQQTVRGGYELCIRFDGPILGLTRGNLYVIL